MIPHLSFRAKRVLVTGAGRGLGKEIVRALVKNEATVLALSRTKSNLDSLKKEFPSVQTICVDIQDWSQTRKLIKDAGQIDYLINNAALNIAGSIMSATSEDFQKTMDTNVRSALNISQTVADGMIKRGGGSIVFVSSIAAKTPIIKQGIYAISKAALGMLSKSLALELGKHNIRVNTVNPTVFPSDMSAKSVSNPDGPFLTNLRTRTPLNRIANVEEIVNAVLFILSDATPMINGQEIMVCGGFTTC